ncbi:hypothetical protein [Candidatus Albibeggiatoa sp. nov. NOAA]|uniref:hypothetical protein n=1 Tax=Candidatus Albibeggiatoa sp. nov. NOAA TaxID=3162724 RepID=UPI0032FA8170|nr:hypothetical protein [Thiotrichaceae bacterium]
MDNDKIDKYTEALNGPAPEFDPDWEVTQELLKMVTMQARQLMYLQKQLDIMKHSRSSSMETLMHSINRSMTMQHMNQKTLKQEDVKTAVAELNKSIESAAKGERAAQYAGNVLKFIARVII